jgi:hypothetical protein
MRPVDPLVQKVYVVARVLHKGRSNEVCEFLCDGPVLIYTAKGKAQKDAKIEGDGFEVMRATVTIEVTQP